MTAPRFLARSEDLLHDRVLLTGAEGRHAVVVRRLGVTEVVELTDGRGVVVVGSVVAAGPAGLEVEVTGRRREPAPAPRLVVAQALAKGARAEAAVEAMTEVGVDEVLPWAAERCVVQWRAERGAKALERWKATAREAAKQARRAWLPEIGPLVDTGTLTARVRGAALAVVLHEEATTQLARLVVPPAGEVLLVVGPEGGITPAEISAFVGAGAVLGGLGPTVLRTSTAGVVAAAVVLSASRWRQAYQDGEDTGALSRTGEPPVQR